MQQNKGQLERHSANSRLCLNLRTDMDSNLGLFQGLANSYKYAMTVTQWPL